MTELLDEFEEKREALRNIVEEHVRNRDRLSEESQKFAAERDVLNAKVRELRDAAKEKIAEKSALIEQVQKLRAEKECIQDPCRKDHQQSSYFVQLRPMC